MTPQWSSTFQDKVQNCSLKTETEVEKEESKHRGVGRRGKTKTARIKNPGKALTTQAGLQGVKKKGERGT